MLSHKPVSFTLTSLDHFVSFIIFAQKTFSKVFPELKVGDKIIITANQISSWRSEF